MRIDQLLAGSEPVFSFEFFPPKTPEGEKNLYAALADLRPLEPAFVSVTYGAGGGTREKTIEIVKRLKDEWGLEAMAHFTCVGATVPELRATLEQMREAGLADLLVARAHLIEDVKRHHRRLVILEYQNAKSVGQRRGLDVIGHARAGRARECNRNGEGERADERRRGWSAELMKHGV